MPSAPQGPSGPADIRSTLLFRTLAKGKTAKLGRPLAEDELLELEQHVVRASSAGVHVAKHLPVSEAAKAAVASLPKALQGLPTSGPARRVGRYHGARRKVAQRLGDVGALVRQAIAEQRFGPKLPPFARRTSALHVQQDDLESLIPDGWGAQFPTEAGRLGRAVGLPPAAIPLLCLLEWTASFRPPLPFSRDRHECGAGFQVSLDWLERKMGRSRVWVQALLNRLDPYAAWRRLCGDVKRGNRRRAKAGMELLPLPEKPTGTAYVHRFRRLKRYEDLCDDAAKRHVWVDAKGRVHWYCDVRGVVYLTSAGRGVLGTRKRPLEAAEDVGRKGLRSRWLIAARLRRGHSLLGGGHATEVIENREELGAAPALPENLSPNHSPLQKLLKS